MNIFPYLQPLYSYFNFPAFAWNILCNFFLEISFSTGYQTI